MQENFRSSQGIVETARAFIWQSGERLPKEMQPTGAQSDEKGDIVALNFDSPDEKADYIAATPRSLHGVAIREDGKRMRGIACAEMAVLPRTERGRRAPIMRALDWAKVPYVAVGINNLCYAREALAARTLFYFMVGRAKRADVRKAWLGADLGVAPEALEGALVEVEATRQSLTELDEQR